MHGIPEQPINRLIQAATEAKLRRGNQVNIFTNVTDATRSIQNAGKEIAGKTIAFFNGSGKVPELSAREVSERLIKGHDIEGYDLLNVSSDGRLHTLDLSNPEALRSYAQDLVKPEATVYHIDSKAFAERLLSAIENHDSVRNQRPDTN